MIHIPAPYNATTRLEEIHDLMRRIVPHFRLLNENKQEFTVYHGGPVVTQDIFKDVVWFSTDPLTYFGEMHRYRVSFNNPLVVNAQGAGWSDKLWCECCDEDGNPDISPDEPRLTKTMPAFLWKYAQESPDEIEYGDIPSIVKAMGLGYDGVIMRQIGETPNCSIVTDDYVVFSLEQVELID